MPSATSFYEVQHLSRLTMASSSAYSLTLFPANLMVCRSLYFFSSTSALPGRPLPLSSIYRGQGLRGGTLLSSGRLGKFLREVRFMFEQERSCTFLNSSRYSLSSAVSSRLRGWSSKMRESNWQVRWGARYLLWDYGLVAVLGEPLDHILNRLHIDLILS